MLGTFIGLPADVLLKFIAGSPPHDAKAVDYECHFFNENIKEIVDVQK